MSTTGEPTDTTEEGDDRDRRLVYIVIGIALVIVLAVLLSQCGGGGDDDDGGVTAGSTEPTTETDTGDTDGTSSTSGPGDDGAVPITDVPVESLPRAMHGTWVDNATGRSGSFGLIVDINPSTDDARVVLDLEGEFGPISSTPTPEVYDIAYLGGESTPISGSHATLGQFDGTLDDTGHLHIEAAPPVDEVVSLTIDGDLDAELGGLTYELVLADGTTLTGIFRFTPADPDYDCIEDDLAPNGFWDDASWDDLPVRARIMKKLLGWNREYWESGDDNVPPSDHLYFADLNPIQAYAAYGLCWTPDAWDNS